MVVVVHMVVEVGHHMVVAAVEVLVLEQLS